jgi:hypothetical protein
VPKLIVFFLNKMEILQLSANSDKFAWKHFYLEKQFLIDDEDLYRITLI